MRYIVIGFAFMAAAYYHLSGGADFVAEQRETPPEAVQISAAAPPPESEPEPEIETVAAPMQRLTTRAPLGNATAAPRPAPAETVEDVFISLADPQAGFQMAEPQPDPPAPRYEVASESVNMRNGPGTGFDVIATLPQGTATEVTEVDITGWARIRLPETDETGWIAMRLLRQISN